MARKPHLIAAALQGKSGDSPSLQQLSLDSQYGYCFGDFTAFGFDDVEKIFGVAQTERSGVRRLCGFFFPLNSAYRRSGMNA